ncbi:unnamed protein product [Sphagnum balticum]
MVDNAGTKLATSTANMQAIFLNQVNGGDYPCGNNGYSAGGSVRCYILYGDYANGGTPTRIIMTGFTYVSQMNCRFVFNTPAVSNAFFSVIVRAYGGVASASNPYGNYYMGFWEFNEIFQVYTSSSGLFGTSYNSNNKRLPSQSPWRNSTNNYVFSESQSIAGTRSSMAVIQSYNSNSGLTDPSFCEATLGSTNSYDDMLTATFVIGGVTTKQVYFIRTWPLSTDASYNTGTGWTLSYLKCKYFANFYITAYWAFSDTSVEAAVNNFNVANSLSISYSGITAANSVYFSQNYYITDGTSPLFVH